MRDERGDVVVVGAGLIGLAIAFELAERGAAVRIFDLAEPAGAASWAGAGMLAPYTERVGDGAFLKLCASSLSEYPAFLARVRAAGGIDAHLKLTGVMHAAFSAAQLEALHRRAQALESQHAHCSVLERGALLEAEPWLGASVVGGLAIWGEGCVDNRRMGRALVAACAAAGVHVERSSFIRVECDARRVLGIHADVGFVGAGTVVNACGAWAAQLAGVPQDCVPPIEPIKGQMVALAAPSGFVRRPTWFPGGYLVPREDGRLLVGATVESVGFDERVTADGVRQILHAALVAAPSLSDFALTESWAGLRPGTPDGLPFLGPTPIRGFFLATGHYRNGILLAPATARLTADVIEGSDLSELKPFLLDRLGTEEGRVGRITHA